MPCTCLNVCTCTVEVSGLSTRCNKTSSTAVSVSVVHFKLVAAEGITMSKSAGGEEEVTGGLETDLKMSSISRAGRH